MFYLFIIYSTKPSMVQSTLRGITEWVYWRVRIEGNFRLDKSKVEKLFLLYSV
jgi:hypothetical protein